MDRVGGGARSLQGYRQLQFPQGRVVGGRLYTGQEVLASDCEHRASEKEITVSGSSGEAAPPT